METRRLRSGTEIRHLSARKVGNGLGDKGEKVAWYQITLPLFEDLTKSKVVPLIFRPIERQK